MRKMRELIILVPDIDPEQNIEIDVRIDGKSSKLKYRVELVSWDGSNSNSDEKFTSIKYKINEFEKDWELIEIGLPKENTVPLMFRKKNQ